MKNIFNILKGRNRNLNLFLSKKSFACLDRKNERIFVENYDFLNLETLYNSIQKLPIKLNHHKITLYLDDYFYKIIPIKDSPNLTKNHRDNQEILADTLIQKSQNKFADIKKYNLKLLNTNINNEHNKFYVIATLTNDILKIDDVFLDARIKIQRVQLSMIGKAQTILALHGADPQIFIEWSDISATIYLFINGVFYSRSTAPTISNITNILDNPDKTSSFLMSLNQNLMAIPNSFSDATILISPLVEDIDGVVKLIKENCNHNIEKLKFLDYFDLNNLNEKMLVMPILGDYNYEAM